MYQIEECAIDDRPTKASEILRLMEQEDIARCNRGSLNKAFILPGFQEDADHWGHSSLAVHGPGTPPPGNSIGEVEMLGSAHSELHIRNAAKSLEQCKRYIDLALDLDARDTSNSGYTALHYAAKWDRIEVMKMLVLAGAEHNIKNWEGETPLVLARKRGNYGFIRALQELLEAKAAQLGSPEEWYQLPEDARGCVPKKSPTKRAGGPVALRQSEGLEEAIQLTERFGLSLKELQSIKAGFDVWDHSGAGAISLADIDRVVERAGHLEDARALLGMVGEHGLIPFEVFLEAAAQRVKKLRPSGETEGQCKEKQQRVDSPPGQCS